MARDRGASRRAGLLLAPAVLALAGCVAGPNYVPPRLTAPAAFPSAAGLPDAPGPDDPARWWRALGDAELSAAVERALDANPDLEIAAARVVQARADLASVAALRLPVGEAGALAGRGRDSRRSPEGRILTTFGAPVEDDLYIGGVSVAWESDLFGGVRRGVEARAAGAQFEARRLEAARVAVAAETARAYVALRGLQIRRAILDQRLACAGQRLALARRRVDEGAASLVEVRRAEAELAQVQLAGPRIDAGLTTALDALDTLQGRPLGSGRALLDEPPRLPLALAARVMDSPADVLARRPDVRAAERAVAEANAGVGVAVAQYYPSVTLNALAGLSSTASNQLLQSDAGLWLGFVGVRWRILDWRRIDADVAAARGRKAEALAAYRKTALAAAAEIDTAMARLHDAAEAVREADALTLAARRTEALADRARQEGAAALPPVLEARARRLEAEDGAATARLEAVEASIDLYRSLGLGA